jgi:hypothetical protein
VGVLLRVVAVEFWLNIAVVAGLNRKASTWPILDEAGVHHQLFQKTWLQLFYGALKLGRLQT